jgi:CheY-like chemotaxis protein
VSPNQDSRIIVVDDEHVSASTLAAILQKSGFSARFFTCPREALAAARSEAPDLLICHVTMPDHSAANRWEGDAIGGVPSRPCRRA